MNRPRLFQLATAISVLLWIAVVLLWAISLVRMDSISFESIKLTGTAPTITHIQHIARFVTNSNGHFTLHSYVIHFSPSKDLDQSTIKDSQNWRYSHQNISANLHQLGFDWYHKLTSTASRTRTDLHLAIPYWAILLPLSFFPALALVRKMKAKRQIGQCTTCGYDLRATPQRCPECGTPAANIVQPLRRG